MKQLRCVNITSIAFIGMLFCAGVMEATGQNGITSMIYSTLNIETDSTYIYIKYIHLDNLYLPIQNIFTY